MLTTYSHSWASSLGSILIHLRLSPYRSGQPRLVMAFANGAREELTIEVPGFDTRAFDADFAFKRLHMVFRSPDRASLLAGCDVVQLTPHVFTLAGSGEPALQLVWLWKPDVWSRIEREAVVQ